MFLNILAKPHKLYPHLKDDQNASDNARVTIDHGLLHDVTYRTKVASLHGLFSYEGSQMQTTAGC